MSSNFNSFQKNKKEKMDKRSQDNLSFSFENLKDFPELKVYSTKCKVKSGEKNESGESIPCKSWLPVAHSNKGTSDLKEAFPKLPVVKGCKKINKLKDKPEVKNCSVLIEQENEENRKVENDSVNRTKKESSHFSKKPLNVPQRNPNKKKRTDPIFLNLNDLLKVKKNNRKIEQSKIVKSKFQRGKSRENLSGNILDSSNPKRSRGKHREIKKKKLTNLKFLILKERIIKYKIREKSIAEYLGKEYTDLIENIDFKKEIKNYLSAFKKNSVFEQRNNKTKENFNTAINNEEIENVKTKLNEKKEINSQPLVNSSKTEGALATVKKIQFSSKLREYCDNLITPELNAAASEFIKELVNLQDKLFARDPIKAKIKRRHVSGLKEIKKHLNMKKVKIIIIAPNLEKLQMQGSVYDLISELKSIALSQEVPYVFALDRYVLGRCARKSVPISAFAVLNYDGIEKLFELLVQEVNLAKKLFSDISEVDKEEERKQADVTSEVISSFMSKFNEGLQISD